MEKIRIDIKGMTCVSCAVSIEKNLKKVKGVENASVNFSTKTAEVEFNDKLTNEKELFDVITNQGYTPINKSVRDVEFKEIGRAHV